MGRIPLSLFSGSDCCSARVPVLALSGPDLLGCRRLPTILYDFLRLMVAPLGGTIAE
jgi:hypothetical protein